jgi:hypothetical protein
MNLTPPLLEQAEAACTYCADFVIGFNGKHQSQTCPDVQSSAIAHPPAVLAQWQMTSHLPNQKLTIRRLYVR